LETERTGMQAEIDNLTLAVRELYFQVTGNYPQPLEAGAAPMVMSLGADEGDQTATSAPAPGSRRDEILGRIREILESRGRGEASLEAEPPALEQNGKGEAEASMEGEPPALEQNGNDEEESSLEAEPPALEQNGNDEAEASMEAESPAPGQMATRNMGQTGEE
ncbi:MAG: hypothetical protein K2J70_08175, partial [Muribaculaceae bacterium]|nr:hypothetical protein [Muribaculaceae bacterium]